MRPVIHYCLRRGIKLQALVALAKELFVELALEEINESDAAPSSSKLSVMTGVHRKDLSKLLSAVPDGTDAKPISSDIISRVIGHWQHSPQYQTAEGIPKTLDCQGTDSEFAQLVSSVSKELSAYPILFELERIGAVAREDSTLTLKKKLYVERNNVEEGYKYLSEDSDDLLHAVEENLTSENKTLNLHIKTEFDRIPARYLEELRKWILFEGTQFHQKLREHLSSYDVEINTEHKVDSDTRFARVAIGSFSRTIPCKQEDENE